MSQQGERSIHPSTIPVAARAYQGRRAGVISRVVASAVDLCVVIAIVAVLYGIISGVVFLLHPRSFSFPAGLGWSIPTVSSVVAVPYLVASWCTTGRTYGDALLGLRVVSNDGKRLNLVVAVLRALAYVIFPIGLGWVAVSRENRSVQDIVLGTSVVYDWAPNPDTVIVPR